MKIFLIRHGQTTGDLEGRYGGDYDDPHSETGEHQIQALAERLKDAGIQKIYSSPKIRAQQCAAALAVTTGAPIAVCDDLREMNGYGVLSGLTKAEALATHPEEVVKLAAGPINHNVAGSEPYSEFRQRLLRQFDDIVSNESGQVIAIVTHGGVIRCVVREKLKLGEMSQLGDCAVLTLLDVSTEAAMAAEVSLLEMANAALA